MSPPIPIYMPNLTHSNPHLASTYGIRIYLVTRKERYEREKAKGRIREEMTEH